METVREGFNIILDPENHGLDTLVGALCATVHELQHKEEIRAMAALICIFYEL